MKKEIIIAILCTFLIINLPFVLSEDLSYEQPDTYEGYSTSWYSGGKEVNLGESIIINIDDYEPKLLRQSMLEQQNAPVYISLKGTTVGTVFSALSGDPQERDPLSGVNLIPPIRDIEITTTNKSSQIIGTPRYIAPRSNDYSLNNLGYLVVNVKKLDPKEETPDVVSLDLNAKIYFDFEKGGLFGISNQDLMLKPENKDQFLAKLDKSENSFYNTRGYVIATKIDSDSVRLNVYNRELNEISFFQSENPFDQQGSLTLTLNNKISPALSFGENSQNPFGDSFRIQLNEILTPQDKAYVEIRTSSNTYNRALVKGSKIYAGSGWFVRTIEQSEPTTTTIAELKQKLGMIDPATEAELAKYTNLQLVNNILVLENQKGDVKRIERETIQTETGIPPTIVSKLTDEGVLFLEENYCNGLNPNVKPNDFACEAVNKTKQFLTVAYDSNQFVNAYYTLAEVYLDNLIDFKPCQTSTFSLSDCRQFQIEMSQLGAYYIEKAKSQGGSRQDLDNKLQKTVFGTSTMIYLEDEGVSINLLNVKKIQPSEKAFARMKVGSNIEKPYPIGYIFSAEIPTQRDSDGEEYTWILDGIESNRVKLRKSYSGTTKGSSEVFLINEKKALQYWTPTKQEKERGSSTPESIDIEVTGIEVQNEAYITILPGSGKAYSTSEFTLNIPIDKRLPALTPEQLQNRIDITKDLISELDNVINKFDSFVKTWKKTCLVTFAFLTVKSSLFGGSRSLARRSVSTFYKEKCRDEIVANKFSTPNECYQNYSEEIEKATSEHEQVIDSYNDEFSDAKTAEELATKSEEFKKFRAMGGTMEEFRQGKTLEMLKATINPSSPYYKYVEAEYEKVKFDERIKRYNEAYAAYHDPANSAIFKGFTEEQALQSYNQALMYRGTPALVEGTTPVSSLVINKDGTGIIHEWDAGHTRLSPKKIIPISELAYQYHLSGNTESELLNKIASEVCTRSENPQDPATSCYNNVKARMQVMSQTIQRLPSGEALAVEEQFIQTGTLNGVNGQFLKFGPTGAHSEFRLYSSSIVTQEGTEIQTNKAYTLQSVKESPKGIVAQYSSEGKAICYPIGNGEYIEVLNRFQSGSVDQFRVMFIGQDGIINCGGGDDGIKYTQYALDPRVNKPLHDQYYNKINSAPNCKKDGDVVGTIDNKNVICTFAQSNLIQNIMQPQCIDVMDPSDCKILFNACDPVMCPPSRCNLGGRYQVNNVISSGFAGSLFLCAPNFKEGVMVPVCLTGLLASMKNIRSILDGYVGCLEASLKGEGEIGICDYIRAVGYCELVWKEAINVFRVRGGIVDWLTEKVTGQTEGGAEYLTFQSSLTNVGDSFNYFTTEYSNTFLAAYKSQSAESIGTQICRVAVETGEYPNLGKILDQLSEPEDPPQFTAFFDTSPYLENLGEVKGSSLRGTQYSTKQLSLYKIFYHIYAGTGMQQQSLFGEVQTGIIPKNTMQYSVFLRNKEMGLPDFYVTTNPQSEGINVQTIEYGKAVQQTIQTPAALGYNQICILISGQQEQCGFGKVATSFFINELGNYAAKSEALKGEIDTAAECIPSGTTTGTALGSLTTPESYGLLQTGIIRVCNPTMPTNQPQRWTSVGTCGKDSKGIDQGTCWLDKNSVSISDLGIASETEIELKARSGLITEGDIYESGDSTTILQLLNQKRNEIIERIKSLVDQAKRSKTP